MNKLKKRKLSLLALCTGLTGLTMGVLFFSGKGLGSFSPRVSAGNDYILTLNSLNGGTSFSSSYSSSEQTNTAARTNRGSEVDIKYSNVKKSTNNYAVVANNGYLYNSTRLTGLETVTVTFSGTLNLYSSSSTTFDGSAHVLTSGVEFAIDANYDYFKLVSSGETTISSVVATYACAPRVVNYVKVTNQSEVTDGTYLIVNEEAGKALNGAGTAESEIKLPQSVSIVDNKITASQTVDSFAVNIDINGSDSAILTKGGVYIGSNGNSTTTTNSSPISNSITISDGNADIVSATSHLRYNAGSAIFRYYKSTSYTGQDAVALYKRTAGTAPVDPVDPSGDEPTTATYEITINKSNSGLTTSASTEEINRSYNIGDTGLTFDVTFSVGAYNQTNYDQFRLHNSYLISACDVVVKSLWIDFGGGGYSYLTVTANDQTVTGIASSTQGSGNEYDYEINSATWKLNSPSGYANIYSLVFTVEVQLGPIEVTGVSLNKDTTSIPAESTETLVATVLPENATDKSVIWSTSNPDVATVSNNGVVTAVAPGTAAISVTTTDGGFVESCTVTVTAVYHVTSVSLNTNQLNLNTNCNAILTGTISPSNATNKNVVWSSNNEGVATVFEGSVHAVAPGTATITVTTVDGGHTASCIVTVTDVAVSSVTLNKPSTQITKGDTETLTATVLPENATNKGISWTSSNTSVATVANGTVTAVGAGSAVITATSAADSSKKATCTVTVTTIAVTGVTLNKSSTSIIRGGSETLTATVVPSNATNKNVTWSTNNSDVATVSNGVVTAKATGAARITVTTEDGGKTAYCDVTVTPIVPTSITLNKTSLTLQVEAYETLTATVLPANADNTNVTWSSNLTSVATVNSSGKVTAVAEGTTTITATTQSGGLTSTCTVTVIDSSEKTYNFTTKSWTATEGNWVSGQDGAGYDKGGVQVTSAVSGANATSPESFSGVTKVVVTYCTNASKGVGSIAVQVGTTNFTSESNVTKTGGTTPRDIEFTGTGTGTVTITVTCTTNSIYVISVKIVSSRVSANNISLPEELNVAAGGTKSIPVTYDPVGANKDTALTWTKRSGSSKITVSDDGEVSVANDATTSDYAVIRATLQKDSSKYDECTVHVVEKETTYTVMIYMCGSDLESGYNYNTNQYVKKNGGFATANLEEIVSVDIPDNMYVIIETGGADRWYDSFGIDQTKEQRWHVKNHGLVLDENVGNATEVNMSSSKVFEEFLTWGLSNYPADKTGVIMWDHGNGMQGCISDECNGHDVWDLLLMSEMKTAFNNALGGQKLEWIGYDCCLMAMQDIASINADYFNYMIASQESEPAGGWDYDLWLPTLTANADVSTVDLGASICETYKDKCADIYNGYGGDYVGYNDASLAVFDLSKMSAYVSAFESMVTNLGIVSNKTKFNTVVSECVGSINEDTGNSTKTLKFGVGYDEDTEKSTWTTGCCDAYSFLTNVNSKYSSAAKAARDKLELVVVAKAIGDSYASGAHGMNLFIATGIDNGIVKADTAKNEYTTNDTKFTNWRSANIKWGVWYS